MVKRSHDPDDPKDDGRNQIPINPGQNDRRVDQAVSIPKDSVFVGPDEREKALELAHWARRFVEESIFTDKEWARLVAKAEEEEIRHSEREKVLDIIFELEGQLGTLYIQYKSLEPTDPQRDTAKTNTGTLSARVEALRSQLASLTS